MHLISLVSDDLRANISTYGAVLQDLRCNDLPHSLVLGFPNLQPYLTNPPYLGAIVGRYANRIAKARIDGATDHQHLDANQDGLHCLHGGSDGSSSRLWAIIDSGSDFVTLEDIIPDGHMGFVGTLRVNVRYQLAQSNLKIDITATSDAASLCNFTNHSYFNLDGRPQIDQHRLQVLSKRYLPVDETGIPSQAPTPVAGSKYDFRNFSALCENGTFAKIDHNYCLIDRRRPITTVARLSTDVLDMEMASTEPGVHIYTGSGLSDFSAKGHAGYLYRAFAGIALEAQTWPDAPNRPEYPSPWLLPGDVYHHATVYHFARRQARSS
ncbi:galactose mutarotase [Rhodobacteraceae bacterium]|nr:galactose mutarotase [Paracoccaceae bacterium]